MLCRLNSLHYINKEKMFKIIANAPWKSYVKLTVRRTRLLINLYGLITFISLYIFITPNIVILLFIYDI
jgi:hypothetical protein